MAKSKHHSKFSFPVTNMYTPYLQQQNKKKIEI